MELVDDVKDRCKAAVLTGVIQVAPAPAGAKAGVYYSRSDHEIESSAASPCPH